MKTKIVIDLDRDKLLVGLGPRDVHAPYARSEDELVKAEHALARRRTELADHERRVAELPARVSRGEVKASALAEALRERDAAALLIPHAEQALAKARERLAVETTNAAAAVQREISRRSEQLERLAAELAPVLTELASLSCALALKANPLAVSGFSSVEWPCSPDCDAQRRQVAMSVAPVAPMLAWSGNK